MAKLDLAAAANRNAGKGQVWTGGKIDTNPTPFLELVVRAIAAKMGLNLFNGIRPDGSGSMPGRKSDGEPRGKGSKIARALHPRKLSDREWFIAAHLERPGHLARIMGDVPLKPPPLKEIRDAVSRAWRAAFRLAELSAPGGTGGRAGGGSDVGDVIDRRGTARTKRRLRGQFEAGLAELGFGAKGALAKRIRSAARRSIARK